MHFGSEPPPPDTPLGVLGTDPLATWENNDLELKTLKNHRFFKVSVHLGTDALGEGALLVKFKDCIIILATQKKIISKPVIKTFVGKYFLK